jgi:hypothetical protein
MSTDVRGVAPYAYLFGARLRQAQILHHNATGLSRCENRASPEHVSSMLFKLADAADDLIDAIGLPQLEDRVSRALGLIETGWDRWVRADGEREDARVVQQALRDLEQIIQDVVRRLAEREVVEAWMELGNAVVAQSVDPTEGAEQRRERLRGLLERAGAEGSELIPDERDAEGLPLLGLPEDYEGWHQVETGLRSLLRRATPSTREGAPPQVRESLADQRNKWIYEQSFDLDNTWDGIRLRMKREHPEWKQLRDKQGAQQAAKRYAKKYELDPPPPRKGK